jgi:signal transduction histidine kinase
MSSLTKLAVAWCALGAISPAPVQTFLAWIRARTGGAGQGRAIVNEIMKLHGGEVSVATNDGGGAVFTLSFPTLMLQH